MTIENDLFSVEVYHQVSQKTREGDMDELLELTIGADRRGSFKY